MDCSQPGSSVHGISQTRILEWVAIFFFRRSYQLRDQTCVSCIADRFFTVWVTREAQTKDNRYKFICAVNNIRLRKLKDTDGRDGWRKVTQKRSKNTIEHLCMVERFSHGSEKTTTVHFTWTKLNLLLLSKQGKVKVVQSCLTLCHCIVHGILQCVAFPFSRRSSQPRDRTQVSPIAGRFFTIWAIRDAKNTGVGSLCLLLGVCLTQESNWVLLHRRWILYQGSPLF